MPAKNRASARASRRKWYNSNKKKAYDSVSARKKAIREWFRVYKEALKCSRCTEDHTACLDFHHRDPKTKQDIVKMVGNGCATKTIMDEINKCDVLCANCHRKEHYHRFVV